jgi:hypothetical protein
VDFLRADESPFLVLWYLFLGFFGTVVLVNIVCWIAASFFKWRGDTLLAKSTPVKVVKAKVAK